MIQQSHSWAYTQKKTVIKKIYALLCSQQHYLQQSGHVVHHSVMSYSATPLTAACQASLSTVSQSLPFNHLILCYPLLLFPSVLPSIRVFSNESALHIRWPKYQRFSIITSNEHSGFISFRIDWFDLLAVQGMLKSLLQHHSLKTSVLWHSVFFMVQLSHPYMTTEKTIDLTIQIFVGKVMSRHEHNLNVYQQVNG